MRTHRYKCSHILPVLYKKKKKEKDANIAFEVKLPEEFVQR